MSRSEAISLQGIEHRYEERIVLQELDLSIRSGEMLCMLGASGCGKSTIVRLIAGLERPYRGSISLFGKDASRIPSHERRIAMVSQTAGCYDHLSVEENLLLSEQLARAERADPTGPNRSEVIEGLELQGHLQQRPSQLSGGLSQRLAIARAFLSGRPILLMDEPLAHLHESLRQPIRDLVRAWQRESGRTCLYITHDSMEASRISDRIAVLYDGQVKQIDAPENVYDQPACRQVAELVGTPSIQWFNPRAIGLASESARIGIRPRDWRCISILPAESAIGPPDADSQDIRLHGLIVDSRRIESEWWLRIEFGAAQKLLAILPRWLSADSGGIDLPSPQHPDGNDPKTFSPGCKISLACDQFVRSR
ncbi:MAG: ABC transporter ATP-binding protein [Planctomycetota bacterium]